MNLRTAFFLAGSALILVVSFGLVNKTAAKDSAAIDQGQDRVIVKKFDFDPPVKILEIRTRKGAIESGKPYADDDDWLRGLTVKLNNKSGQALTYVNVEIWFRRPPNQSDKLPGVWHLSYGDDPFFYATGEPILPLSVLPIQDGESFELTLNEHDFYQVKSFLHEIEYSALNEIEVRVTTIGFSDGTAWTGRMMRRDPASRIGWSMVEQAEKNLPKIKS